MVFSGVTFLIYFLPVFFLIYYSIPYKFKNGWIVVASILFYSWGAPVFVLTLLCSCLLDFYISKKLAAGSSKLWLMTGLSFNIALLAYFKYADFFIENFNVIFHALFGSEIPLAHIILPVGISFVTFQKISYLIDIYRKDCRPPKSIINYLTFVLLFPQLIAGPIVRFKDINLQILNRKAAINNFEIYDGFIQFVIGLSKKVLIANTIGVYADSVFDSDDILNHNAITAWTGILAYTFQIYYDFSGYSDMAIGLGKMMGFSIPVNFNFPYTSGSITEFWRRWHITLGSWMKDYLYIPLGGNRNNRTLTNLFIVFFISGLWHGASWNFVFWGLFHGSFLVLERIGFTKILNFAGKVSAVAITFLIVVLGWVLFRSENLFEAGYYYTGLLNIKNIEWSQLSSINSKVVFMFIVGALFAFTPKRWQRTLTQIYSASSSNKRVMILSGATILLLYFINVGELMTSGFNPFIYFRF